MLTKLSVTGLFSRDVVAVAVIPEPLPSVPAFGVETVVNKMWASCFRQKVFFPGFPGFIQSWELLSRIISMESSLWQPPPPVIFVREVYSDA